MEERRDLKVPRFPAFLGQTILLSAVLGTAVDATLAGVDTPRLALALLPCHGIGAAFIVLASCLWWTCLRPLTAGTVLPRWARSAALGLPLTALMAGVGWILTKGPQAASSPLVFPLRAGVGVTAVLGGSLAASFVSSGLGGAGRVRPWHLCAGAVSLFAGALWLNARTFPNTYPIWHEGLLGAALLGLATLAAGLGRGIGVNPLLSILGWALVMLSLGWAATRPDLDNRTRRLLFRDAPLISPHASRWLAPFTGQSETAANRAHQIATQAPVDPTLLDRRLPFRHDARIVWITLDALRPDHLGSYGYPLNTSPALDAFAKDSAVFLQAYAQHPSSQLSLSSMFQGVYPSTSDVFSDRSLPNKLRTPRRQAPWARRLLEQGWQTAGVTSLPKPVFESHFPYLADGFERLNPFPWKAALDGAEVTRRGQEALGGFQDRPWFLWLHYFDVHDPYQEHPDGPFPGSDHGLYDGEIRYLDDQLNPLFATLAARPDWDRTVVVIHADHGEELEDHGGRFHGTSLFEEQVRVPLILRIPGLPGSRIQQVVELVDVVPTLTELLALPPATHGTHGHTLTTLLLHGDAAENPAPAVAYFELHPSSNAPPQDGLRWGPWKLISHRALGIEEAYHLEVDPGERDDRGGTDDGELAIARGAHLAYRNRAATSPLGAASEADPAHRARNGDASELRAQGFLLLARGREAELKPILREALDRPAEVHRRMVALELLTLVHDPDAVPSIIRALESPEPGVKLSAILALAAQDPPTVPRALHDLSTEPDPTVAGAAVIARGLLGDEAVGDRLRSWEAASLGGRGRVLTVLARARLGNPDARAAARSLVRNPPPDPALHGFALRALSHQEDPLLVPDLWTAARATTVEDYWMRAETLLHLVRAQQEESVVPLLRLGILRRTPQERAALVDVLGAAARVPWNAAGALQPSLDGPDPARRADALAAVIRSDLRSGVLDWGLAYELWSDGLASGQPPRQTLGSLPGLEAWPENSVAMGLLKRWEALGSTVGEADPEGYIERIHADPESDQGLVALIVRVHLSASSAPVAGGPAAAAPMLRVETTGEHGAAVRDFYLPVTGITAGAAETFLLVLPSPPGRRPPWTLTLVQQGRAIDGFRLDLP